MNVRGAGLLLEGHLFEFTDLPGYWRAVRVNEQHPPERQREKTRHRGGDG